MAGPGTPTPSSVQKNPGAAPNSHGTIFPSLSGVTGPEQTRAWGRGVNSRFSSWSPTTLRRATEIMKRLRRKQTSQSFPAAAPHTARTTPW